jgi:hypothetical protein
VDCSFRQSRSLEGPGDGERVETGDGDGQKTGNNGVDRRLQERAVFNSSSSTTRRRRRAEGRVVMGNSEVGRGAAAG